MQKSPRSGLLLSRCADNLNPCTFKSLYITWSLHDAQHMGAEIIMNYTAPGVQTAFLQISLRLGLL